MLFALGLIAGIALCTFIAVVLLFFRKPFIEMTAPVVKAIELSAPRARGFIVEPVDEATAARQAHIRKNTAQGKDTPVSELM